MYIPYSTERRYCVSTIPLPLLRQDAYVARADPCSKFCDTKGEMQGLRPETFMAISADRACKRMCVSFARSCGGD